MKLSFRHLELRLVHRWNIARGSAADTLQTVVLELTAADGTVGRGEAAPISRYRESVKTVEAFLKQVAPRALSFGDIEGSMSYLDTISKHDMSAKCAVNLALLDGAGKKASKPVYDLLGLGFQEGKHVTSFTIGIDTPEVLRQKVQEAQTFPVLKVKLGVADDKKHLRAIREAGPDKIIRVDANEGWKTKEQALELIEWLATDGKVQYVEQPMPASTSHKDWAWLKQRSPLPIFADESYHVAEDAERIADCFHGANVKLVKTGGITRAKTALETARKAGLSTMVGCMVETSISSSAGAHLAGLCDYIDLDGYLLIKNDPYEGMSVRDGWISFQETKEQNGLRVRPRPSNPT